MNTITITLDSVIAAGGVSRAINTAHKLAKAEGLDWSESRVRLEVPTLADALAHTRDVAAMHRATAAAYSQASDIAAWMALAAEMKAAEWQP